MSKTAFISGHTDLSELEFETHYKDAILTAIADKHKFVIGSARGGDTLALHFLLNNGVSPTDITVYAYERNIKNLQERLAVYTALKVNTRTGFASYTSRDAMMTKESDYDIAWVRPAEECKKLYGDSYKERVSGTELNLQRRAKGKK